ncbi:MAG: NUDIX domain-containing protein [Clostridia bacterium]|nr:NUDIX domain-containing protein [Clostridia bacterium]
MGTIIVGGVIEKDGKFLLVQEAQEKCRGKWNIPAGHLDANETIFEGAKREVFEECGCKVELSGILQIVNKVKKDTSWISVVFSTILLEDNIVFDKDEILDVKWFSYEEILNMKEELRDYAWITDAITALVNNRISDMGIIKMME